MADGPTGLGNPEGMPLGEKPPVSTPETEARSTAPATEPPSTTPPDEVALRRSYLESVRSTEQKRAAGSLVATLGFAGTFGNWSDLARFGRAGLNGVVTATATGNYGADLGLQTYSAERGRAVGERIAELQPKLDELLSRKVSSDPDEYAKLEADRQALLAEVTQALAEPVAIARANREHKLFGTILDERYAALEPKVEKTRWERLKTTVGKVRASWRRDDEAKETSLTQKLGAGLGKARSLSWQTLKTTFGTKEGWKMVGTVSLPWIATALSPTLGVATMGGLALKQLGVSRAREQALLKEMASAEKDVQEQFKVVDNEHVRALTNYLVQLEQSAADTNSVTDAELAEALERATQALSADIAQRKAEIIEAVKQARFEGGSAGLAASAGFFAASETWRHSHAPVTAEQQSANGKVVGTNGSQQPQDAQGQQHLQGATRAGATTGSNASAEAGPGAKPVTGPGAQPQIGPGARPDGTTRIPDSYAPTPEGQAPEAKEHKVGGIFKLDIDGDGKAEAHGKFKEWYRIHEDTQHNKYIEVPYLDKNGDGIIDHQHDLLDKHSSEFGGKYKDFVRVYIDHKTNHGGMVGVHVTVDGAGEHIHESVELLDKDEYMRHHLKTPSKWDSWREGHAKSPLGGQSKFNVHETKGWGAVPRVGTMASFESGNPGSIEEQIPNVQLTKVVDAAKRQLEGTWLAGKDAHFQVVFEGTPLSADHAKQLTAGLPHDVASAILRSPHGYESGRFSLHHFTVEVADTHKTERFADALLHHRRELPRQLMESLGAIHPDHTAARDALADSLQHRSDTTIKPGDIAQAATEAKEHAFADEVALSKLPGKSMDKLQFEKLLQTHLRNHPDASSAEAHALRKVLKAVREQVLVQDKVVLNRYEGKTYLRFLSGAHRELKRFILPALARTN